MNHPSEAPKLPKLPFIAGDLVLVATAAAIAFRGPAPLTPVALVAVAVCVIAGAALAVIPFMADYACRQDAELSERQNQIAALARTTADSAEQLGIAASGLQTLNEASRGNLDAVEKIPAQLKSRIDELVRQLSVPAPAAKSAAQDETARLDAAADKIAKTLAKLEAAAKTKSDASAAAEKDLAAALARATAQIDALVAAAREAADALRSVPVAPAVIAADPAPAPAAEAAPVTPAAPEPVPLPEPAPAAQEPAPEVPTPPPEAPSFAPAEPDAAEVPVEPPPAPKPPRARKPRPADDIPDLGLTPETSEPAESALSSDGFTRLVATAYIGIGNKLYIRGDGPGLSWDKGVPLQFVSIGKWRWETADASAAFTAKLYKNDQVECTGLGLLSLEPGHQHEVNAGF